MFTKKDLKNKMLVITHNGERFMVIDNTLMGMNHMLNLDCYTEDLRVEDGVFIYDNDINAKDYDIDVVYDSNIATIKDVAGLPGFLGLPLWERPVVKEMTVAEIEKELGYSIKIVKE